MGYHRVVLAQLVEDAKDFVAVDTELARQRGQGRVDPRGPGGGGRRRVAPRLRAVVAGRRVRVAHVHVLRCARLRAGRVRPRRASCHAALPLDPALVRQPLLLLDGVHAPMRCGSILGPPQHPRPERIEEHRADYRHDDDVQLGRDGDEADHLAALPCRQGKEILVVRHLSDRTLDRGPGQRGEEAEHRIWKGACPIRLLATLAVTRPQAREERPVCRQEHAGEAKDEADDHQGQHLPDLQEHAGLRLAAQHAEQDELPEHPHAADDALKLVQRFVVNHVREGRPHHDDQELRLEGRAREETHGDDRAAVLGLCQPERAHGDGQHHEVRLHRGAGEHPPPAKLRLVALGDEPARDSPHERPENHCSDHLDHIGGDHQGEGLFGHHLGVREALQHAEYCEGVGSLHGREGEDQAGHWVASELALKFLHPRDDEPVAQGEKARPQDEPFNPSVSHEEDRISSDTQHFHGAGHQGAHEDVCPQIAQADLEACRQEHQKERQVLQGISPLCDIPVNEIRKKEAAQDDPHRTRQAQPNEHRSEQVANEEQIGDGKVHRIR
mmetsp:Transcript_100838/g.308296  ORF Transcript_100838/g.308296 Transcript_100838/m.308296 type:complete len:555 (+) Transcript_100838:396-2060(+)